MLVHHKSIKLTRLPVSLRFSHYLSLRNKILLERALSLSHTDTKTHCRTELILLDIKGPKRLWKRLQAQGVPQLISWWCTSHQIIQLPLDGCTGSTKPARVKKALKTSQERQSVKWEGTIFTSSPATCTHVLSPPTASGGISGTSTREDALRIKFLSQLQIALGFFCGG